MNGSRFAAFGLIALMAVGSLVLWAGIPIGWIWVASQMTSSTQPSLGPYLLVIVGTVVSMVLVGKLLGRLNQLYANVTGRDATVAVQMPWNKSMRAERGSGRPTTVLDVVMVVSVGVAAFVAAIWFFFAAGSSLPGA